MKQYLIVISSISVLLVVILGVSFYWFQLRPSQIRRNCLLDAKNGIGVSGYLKYVSPNMLTDEQIEKIYSNCLREHGLEK